MNAEHESKIHDAAQTPEMADQIEERVGDTVQPRAKSMAWSALAAAAVALLIVVLASYFECR